jgi:hypothetical protein
MRNVVHFAALALLLTSPARLSAEEAPAGKGKTQRKASRTARQIDLELHLANLFVIRNDSDFDRTAPTYDENGQSEGFLGTFLQPRLHVALGKRMRFYYETELGLDLWSDRNPDVAVGSDDGTWLSIKQREIWGQLRLKTFSLKAGYQRVIDASGLFVNHWIGNIKLGVGEQEGSGLFVSVGQMPDQTHEGWTWGGAFGNFSTDLTLLALDGGWRFNRNLRLAGGVYYLHDSSTIDHLRQVGAAAVALQVKSRVAYLNVAGMLQFGRLEGGAADLSDATLLAWGATMNGRIHYRILAIDAAFTILSADDPYEGNAALGFLYSGKRPGMSILLKENYTRDLGDNFDEDLGRYDGHFFEMRAGLWGVDLGITVQALKWLKVGIVSALLGALERDNMMGSSFFGAENELVVDFRLFKEAFHLELIGGILVPGKAAAAKVNAIDTQATDLLYFGQAALLMRF